MGMSTKLMILGAIAALVLGLAIAVGNEKPGAARRMLARAGATAFFALLASFFWLSPFGARSRFLTGMAVFFSIGGAISVSKWAASARDAGEGQASATH